MNQLEQAARALIERWDTPPFDNVLPGTERCIEALRRALVVMPPPPECKTEEEKRAYAFGWFKALEVNRAAPAQDPHPPTRHCMCKDCAPSFEDAACNEDEPVAVVATYPDYVDWLREEPPVGTKLYTHPARKPLSDEEIIDTLHEDGCERIENFYVVGPVQKAAVFSFARAIEAKIGEKK